MNITHIRFFVAVAETGGFTRAAERENVTQPTLSAGIKRLEEQLGTRLLDRAKGASLTAAGLRFLPRARIIVEEWRDSRRELAARTGGGHRLAVGALRTLPVRPLARLLSDFARAHPDIALELVEGSPEFLAARLDRGVVDIAVTVPDSSGGARQQPLYRESFLVAAADAHPLARRARWQIADFQGEPFIYRPHCERRTETLGVFDAHGVRPRIVHRAADDERAILLVAAGLGFCLLPESHQADGIAQLLVPELAFQRAVGLAWHDRSAEPVALFRSFAGSHDWRGNANTRLDIAH